MNIQEKAKRIFEANKAFTPSAPIDHFDLFAGRQKEVQQVLGGVAQKGQHIVIYGERGVGKTSLANVLKYFLTTMMGKQSCVVKVNCDGSSTLATIWRSALRDIPDFHEKFKHGLGRIAKTGPLNMEEQVPNDLSPDDIRYILQQIGGSPVIIFDELDRIKSKKTITALSDTIKSLSDHSVPATLILVGVADSVDNLISEHASVERALIQVRMPRMSQDESMEIVQKGLAKLKMGISTDALGKIARLSQGLPHYAHLLGLYSATCAITNNSNEITNIHIRSAIKEAVDHAQQSIKSAYLEAVSSPRGNLYPQVLLSCALAETDELGFFSSVQVRNPMSRVMKKPYQIAAFSHHLIDFCSKEHGPVLQKAGFRRRYRYRFLNPLMQPFILMKGISDGVIEEELWDF